MTQIAALEVPPVLKLTPDNLDTLAADYNDTAQAPVGTVREISVQGRGSWVGIAVLVVAAYLVFGKGKTFDW